MASLESLALAPFAKFARGAIVGLAGMLAISANADDRAQIQLIDSDKFPRIVERKEVAINLQGVERKGIVVYARDPYGYTEVTFENDAEVIRLKNFDVSAHVLEFIAVDRKNDVGTSYYSTEREGKKVETVSKTSFPQLCGAYELILPSGIWFLSGEEPTLQKIEDLHKAIEPAKEDFSKFGKNEDDIVAVKMQAEQWMKALDFEKYVSATAQNGLSVVNRTLHYPAVLTEGPYTISKSENFPPLVWGCGGVPMDEKGIAFTIRDKYQWTEGIKQVVVWATKEKIDLYVDLKLRDTQGKQWEAQFRIEDRLPETLAASPDTFFVANYEAVRDTVGARFIGNTKYTSEQAKRMMDFATRFQTSVMNRFPEEFKACVDYAKFK